MEFGNYNHYEVWPFQVLGVAGALIVFSVVFAGMGYSKLYSGFMKTPENEEKEPDWVDINDEMAKEQVADGDYTNMASLEEPVIVTESDGYINAGGKDDCNNEDDDDDDAPVMA